MGAFFTNVAVRPSPKLRSDGMSAVRALLDRALARDGWKPASRDTPGDVRRLALMPGGAWMTVLDVATEGMRIEDLEALSELLSIAAAGPALGIMVADSDELILSLFDSGQALGWIHLSHEKLIAPQARLKAWARSLGVDASAIAGCLKLGYVFVEDRLLELKEVLGLPDSVMTGFRYLESDGQLKDLELLVYEPDLGDLPAHPAIGALHSPETINLVVGIDQNLTVTFQNEGAGAQGLVLTVAAHPEVAVVAASLTVGSPVSPQSTLASAHSITLDESDYICTFPDLVLPDGMTKTGRARIRMTGEDAFVRRALISHVLADVTLRGAVPGDADLLIELRPIDERGDAGSHEVTAHISASP